MKKGILLALLALYGIIGLAGWFNYVELRKQPYPLPPQLTLSYVKSVVWYHSRGKLQELRSILLTDNLSKTDVIKTRISNMLQHRSNAYIRDFNGLNTPISNLGDWYQSNFDFPNFLDDVFLIVFDDNLDVNTKIRDVTDVMERYQNDALLLLTNELARKGT